MLSFLHCTISVIRCVVQTHVSGTSYLKERNNETFINIRKEQKSRYELIELRREKNRLRKKKSRDELTELRREKDRLREQKSRDELIELRREKDRLRKQKSRENEAIRKCEQERDNERMRQSRKDDTFTSNKKAQVFITKDKKNRI